MFLPSTSSEITQCNLLSSTSEINKDPALWGNVSEHFRARCVDKGPSYFQNTSDDSEFTLSLRQYSKQNRKLSVNLFRKVLANGEKVDRKWPLYSPSTGNVFCYVCKLFAPYSTGAFVKGGFSDWKNAEERTAAHENRIQHT